MGKIDLTTNGQKQGLNHHILGGTGENTPEKIAMRMAQLQEKLANKAPTEPTNDNIFIQKDIENEPEPKKPVIGGEIKDPVKQNLIATISAQEAEIVSLEEELKREKEKNVVSLEKITELKLEISELQKKVIILERPNQVVTESSKLRPVNKTAPRLAGTTTRPPTAESPKQEPITGQTKTSTMRNPAIARLPKRNMVTTTPEVVEQPKTIVDEREAAKDFLHDDKTKEALEEAITVIHEPIEEIIPTSGSMNEVEAIEKAIESEPFLPPESTESTIEEKIENTTSLIDQEVESAPEPTSVVLNNTGEIEYLPKKSNVEKLAGVTTLVDAVFKDAANDPVFLAWSATGKKAA